MKNKETIDYEQVMKDHMAEVNEYASSLMIILSNLIQWMEKDQREKEEATVIEIDSKIQNERKEREKREEHEIAEYQKDQREYEEYQQGLFEAFLQEDFLLKEEERIEKERLERERERKLKEEAEKKRDLDRRQSRNKMRKEKDSARAAKNSTR